MWYKEFRADVVQGVKGNNSCSTPTVCYIRTMNAPLRMASPSSAIRLLELQTFEIAFESALEKIAAGVTLAEFVRTCTPPADNPDYALDASRFRTWIYQNTKRKQAYLAAKAVGAEAVEDELIRISDGLDADGNPSMNDTSRAQLQIATRRWLLGVWNRDRYGDLKRVEQTVHSHTTTDLSTVSTAELNRRVMEAIGLDVDTASTFEHDCDPETP
jgi:hypothetical protein